MNKEKLLYTLRDYIARCPIGEKAERNLKEDLWSIGNRKEDSVVLPLDLPSDSDSAIPILRNLYKDDITKISLVLSHHWPDEYLFLRISSLTRELCASFEFFAEVAPELDFTFSSLHSSLQKNAFDAYLVFNDRLWEFGEVYFGDDADLRDRIHILIYVVLPWLFLETSEYNRYWVSHTSKDVAEYPDNVIWSGRKDMRPNDLVYMYESAPVKAIRTIYVVENWPYFDPWWAWGGIKVNLTKLTEVPEIAFSWMRGNAELSKWSVIQRQFQGVISEPMPHACHNELVSQIPLEIREQYGIHEELVSAVSYSGEFATEAQFEDEIVEPLLRAWGISFTRQFPVKCYFGTQRVTGYVDFILKHEDRPIGLFENKLRIVSDQDLRSAINQAKSYSLMLGLKSFVVGSPEGLKLYSLNGVEEVLLTEWTLGTKSDEEAFRNRLLSVASGADVS